MRRCSGYEGDGDDDTATAGVKGSGIERLILTISEFENNKQTLLISLQVVKGLGEGIS